MSENEEFYVSGFVNCQNCNSFLIEYNQCSKCQKRLCNDCCDRFKNDCCPFCKISPFIPEKNPKITRFINNMKFTCKYCKKQYNSIHELSNHECIKEDLSCVFCIFITKEEEQFLKHIQEKHPEKIMDMMNEVE